MENEQHGRKVAAEQIRVLIVDPHASFRSACRALLQTEGVTVVADLERHDGAEDLATALRPDVVLIDVSLSQSEGLELARRLSAHVHPPAIVLMSATPPDAILADSARAELFLPKAGITASAIAHAARSTLTERTRKMSFNSWGFIYLGLGEEDPAVDRAVIQRGGLKTTVVAVPTREAAVDVAVELVDAGAQSIELCGGFGSAVTTRVIEAVGDRVPVGAVSYSMESVHPLASLFAPQAA
jgi:DNA-binding NarL/FixJ family response regulator